jgi:hypothetical protein
MRALISKVLTGSLIASAALAVSAKASAPSPEPKRQPKRAKTVKDSHSFTIQLKGDGLPDNAGLDRLHEAGCDDGCVSWQSGRLTVEFDREGQHLRHAAKSALRDVRKAGFEPIAIWTEDAKDRFRVAGLLNGVKDEDLV